LQQGPDTIYIVLFIALFVAWWIVVMNVIAAASGWRQLAGSYRARALFSGKKFYACGARLRVGMGNNNVFTVGADPEGMYVSVFALFRPGHPPLFIPWEDVSTEVKRIWWINGVTLRFTRCPSIPFWISRRLADKLEMASDVRFISEINT
jgi:hypothetical protein